MRIRFSHLLIFELWLLFRVRSKQQCFEIRIEPSNNDWIFIYVLRLFGCDKFYQKEVIFPFSFRNSNFSIRRRANNKAVHWALSHWRFRRIYCVFYNELFLNKWFITKEKSWNGLFLHWLFFGGSGRFPWTDGIDAREFRHWNNIISFLHEKRKATTARPLQCIAVYNVCTHTQALTRKSVDFIVVVFFGHLKTIWRAACNLSICFANNLIFYSLSHKIDNKTSTKWVPNGWTQTLVQRRKIVVCNNFLLFFKS